MFISLDSTVRILRRQSFWRGLALGGLLLLFALAVQAPPETPAEAGSQQVYTILLPGFSRGLTCRFGIAAPDSVLNYDTANLNAGSYVNWGLSLAPARPNGLTYVQMVRLGDKFYTNHLASIPAIARANSGSYWLVGNEPDTTYGLEAGGEQDNLRPGVYAERYRAAYLAIKTADPTAVVGIGGLVQPTAVRMEYLDRMLAAYQAKFSAPVQADFWHMHAFVLNEIPLQWGTGLPVDNADWPYTSQPEAISPLENDSLTIFDRRLVAFRQWMASRGQRNKPLWITEYGVLMPSELAGYAYNIPITRTRDFMLGTFNYFNTKTDAATGYPGDGNRLVQRWYWWALSADQTKVGGGLYDTGKAGTPKTILYDAYAKASDCP